MSTNLTHTMYKQIVPATGLNYIEIVKFIFCLDDITDVENLQDVIILTVSNFVKSRSKPRYF